MKIERLKVIAAVGFVIFVTTMASRAKTEPQTPTTTKTEQQTPTTTSDSDKTGVDDPKAKPGAVKTRKASCNCGQLRVTCVGPDPERRSMCHCHLCQKQTGSTFSIQATFPKEQVKIEGKSTAWKFPIEGAPPVTFRNCSRTGVTTHFCPTCGSTVYYVLAETPENIGVRIGCFADPTFPPPIVSGFEAYKFPWAMKAADIQMKHVD